MGDVFTGKCFARRTRSYKTAKEGFVCILFLITVRLTVLRVLAIV